MLCFLCKDGQPFSHLDLKTLWHYDFPSPRPRLTQHNTLCLLFFLSIFIAFILEAFFVAYSLEKSEVETAIEKKIQELGVGVQE